MVHTGISAQNFHHSAIIASYNPIHQVFLKPGVLIRVHTLSIGIYKHIGLLSFFLSWANNILHNMYDLREKKLDSFLISFFLPPPTFLHQFCRGNIFEHKSLYTVKVSPCLIACVTRCWNVGIHSYYFLQVLLKHYTHSSLVNYLAQRI